MIAFLRKRISVILGSIVIASPLLALAQTIQTGYIDSLLTSVTNIIGNILPILMALVVLFIFYGLAKMVFSAGDEEARKTGRQYAIWGVIALVVMVGIYGIVAIVQNIFGLTSGTAPKAPGLPTK